MEGRGGEGEEGASAFEEQLNPGSGHFNDHHSHFHKKPAASITPGISKNLTSTQHSREMGECRLRAKGRDGDAPRPSQPGEAEWEEWVGAW